MSLLLVQKLMSYPLSLPFALFLIFLCKWLQKSTTSKKNIPPSPPKLPIIGNLHQLGKFPHRSLHTLAKQYGRLMSINLGSTPAIVVSSADAASEIMKTHDIIFANRPRSRITCRIIYGGKDLVFSPYGEFWRQIKSICVLQLLSNKKVQSFRNIREEEVSLVLDMITKSNSNAVNVSEIIVMYSSNVLCRTAFGKRYGGENGGFDFKKLLTDFVKVMGEISMGDIIPWLGWLDRVTGLESRVDKVAKAFDDFLERIVQQHIVSRGSAKRCMEVEGDEGENKDFVDILLDAQRENPAALPMDSIKAIVLDMFAAGTDTTYTLIEWAMTELLGHPQVMKKLQDEVNAVATHDKKMLTEDDLEKLKYSKAVLKETLRLHPPLPLLLFREPSQDVKLHGYDVAAKTQIIVNAWAIQRDPTHWEHPDEFRPERFLNTSVDFKVQDFNFIPFGAGRRGCPGVPFAIANAELALVNFVYMFNWKLPDGAQSDTISLPESPGITINRRDPLMASANLRF